jgi:hypothetical protein
LTKKAINEDWSMNPKELEKTPKVPKPQQAAPAVVSWEEKEMNSEEVSHDKGGDNAAGGKVKKFFGRLPSGGAGDAPKSMDLKSGKDEETVLLKKALEAEKAKRIALETKESTAALVDKIADIITTLSEKNLITAEKEEETIKLLSGFKDLALLDGVHALVSSLSVRQADAQPSGDPEVMVGNDAPQVFESVANSDDAITMMSKIWNA